MIFIKILTALLLSISISACQLLPEDTQLKSYRVLVQQGNVIQESKVDELKINMTKEQVIFLLGEPVLNNIFNKNRWDYVYYRKREPEETKLNMISIFFKDEIVISMKRIIKNDDGLFEIADKFNYDEPEFIEDNETTSLKQEVFENITLEGTIDKNIKIEGFQEDESNEKIVENKEISKTDENLKIEGFQEDESNEKIVENKEISKTDENLKKENTEILKKSKETKRKNDNEILSEIINNWAQAWQKKDLEKYFSFYIDGYTSEYFNDHLLWKKDRTERISSKNEIQIQISKLSLEFEISENELAFAIFTQKYISNNYSDEVVKQLSLKKINKKWKIISEEVIKKDY